MSDEDVKLLEYCAKITGKSKSDIIREGIREVYAKITEKK
ncbi:MAG: ribbon-helix-helix protein, CopG family [Oscillospiraceae bacterium]|nr:ribbon-helix-helix protein, CopG family [Oscillospiraceae bacterium]